jgi:hypothetical protein
LELKNLKEQAEAKSTQAEDKIGELQNQLQQTLHKNNELEEKLQQTLMECVTLKDEISQKMEGIAKLENDIVKLNQSFDKKEFDMEKTIVELEEKLKTQISLKIQNEENFTKISEQFAKFEKEKNSEISQLKNQIVEYEISIQSLESLKSEVKL